MDTTATSGEWDRPEQDAETRVSDEDRDSLILSLMFCGSPSYPWSRDELARTTGDRIGTFDAIGRLEASGLVHRIGEFVFPSVACRRAGQLDFG